MKTTNRNRNLFVRTLVGLILCFVFAPSGFAQTETLGAIKYTPPKGYVKNAKDHAVVFSEVDQAKGNFCFITLYAAGVSEGSPQKDFAREWKLRVFDLWGGEANPKTVTEPDNGWTGVAGGTQIDFQGNKAFAFLTVISGFGKTVSVLGILNNDTYLAPLQSFVEKMDIDKTPTASRTTAAANGTASATGPLQYDSYGHLIITPPTRQLTLADLAGNWGEAASFHQRYVYRSSGAYAGADSLTYKSKMTFSADGGFYNDFYAIQNGKMIKEKTGGGFAINGRILVIVQGKSVQKFVIRGWLDMPDMTVLEVCGPFYDDGIPAEILNNPAQGANLNAQWVRKK
ncbi:MAG: hypothetical protein ABL999_01320 [Pyrinomonadaceae bacterium]